MRLSIMLLAVGIAAAPGAMSSAEESRTPATPVLEVSVPKLDCPRPKLPERIASADEAASLTRQVNAYTACATRYVSERRAQAQKHGDVAKQEADAGNTAVKEINDFFASAKQLAQKDKEKAAN